MLDALTLARVAVRVHRLLPLHLPGLLDRAGQLSRWCSRRCGCATGKGVYANLYRYWLKIFAVAFGMGVVSGMVMSYQFGTNWSVFSAKAGPIIGPLMAYEVLTAFFLEAGFLGVMLFGISKVGKGLHFFATCMVALGTLISATWIISVNSWMQTPAGYAINAKGQFVPAGSWLADHLQPELPLPPRPHGHRRLPDDGAGRRRRGRLAPAEGPRQSAARGRMFSMAMWMARSSRRSRSLAGDAHGLNTLEHQPAKVLAMEGDYRAEPARRAAGPVRPAER